MYARWIVSSCRSVPGLAVAMALGATGADAQSGAKRAPCERGKSVAECIESPEAESARRRAITATQPKLSRSAPVGMPSEDRTARPPGTASRDYHQ